jgi:predicted branched-subunit amino acid permease
VSVKRDSLSLSFAVGVYGAAFGAASVAAHFSVFQTCALSLLTFSGASQFAAVGVIGSGGGALSAIATGALLGTRNGLYAVRMAPLLKVRGVKRIIAAQITIDESTGVALAQDNEKDIRTGFWWTGIGVFIFWNIFTLLGALSAGLLKDPAAFGLDALVPAAFVGLVWPRLNGKKSYFLAALAFIFALALAPIMPAGVPIIATSILAVIVGWRA